MNICLKSNNIIQPTHKGLHNDGATGNGAQIGHAQMAVNESIRERYRSIRCGHHTKGHHRYVSEITAQRSRVEEGCSTEQAGERSIIWGCQLNNMKHS